MSLVYLVTMTSFLVFLVMVLVSVAFMILLERSVLGYIQLRKGPNKVSVVGFIQSFGDAVKLFIKESKMPSLSNLFVYYFSPVLSMWVMLVVWFSLSFNSLFLGLVFNFLFIFCSLSMGVYVLIGAGWSSNSNYALLGSLRGVAQTISYEVSLILLLLSLLFLSGSLRLSVLGDSQELVWFFFFLLPIFLCWLVTMMAESNRTPFDFAEGESELVSGFNIEYGSGGFAILFLAEYGMIIFMSYLVSYLFLGAVWGVFELNAKGLFFCFLYLWVRGSLPRFRYDKLMNLVWSGLLPISLGVLMGFSLLGLV